MSNDGPQGCESAGARGPACFFAVGGSGSRVCAGPGRRVQQGSFRHQAWGARPPRRCPGSPRVCCLSSMEANLALPLFWERVPFTLGFVCRPPVAPSQQSSGPVQPPLYADRIRCRASSQWRALSPCTSAAEVCPRSVAHVQWSSAGGTCTDTILVFVRVPSRHRRGAEREKGW
jgi:hypothetical protein